MSISPDIGLGIYGLSKSFGQQRVLQDLHLEVGSDEIVCLLGPSGCGKSTLLNLVAGLLEPDAGRIVKRGRVGYVFQEPRLLPWRPVQDNVAFGLKALGREKDERDSIAREYLQRMGLAGVAAHYPRQLSGGMRQRVSLARALAIEPELLLLDEPFKSLDVLLRVGLLRLLLEEWKRRPRPILFVTHEAGEAALVAHRAVVLMGSPARICAIVHSERPPGDRQPDDPDVLRMEAELYRVLISSECPEGR